MASIHLSELDSNATDSGASSPRFDHHFRDPHARVRFMCSFGGNILPRPHDNQLRYVGGETRIVAVQRSTTFSYFLAKLAKITGKFNFDSLFFSFNLGFGSLDSKSELNLFV